MKRTLLTLTACLMTIASSAQAQTITVGVGDYTRSISVSADEPVYKVGPLNMHPEFGYVQWRVGGDTGYQMYATPTFRYAVTERLSVDAGIGISLFTRTTWGQTDTSTRFQFADHLGVSYQITNTYGVSIRYVHASNAGIKRPNPGVDSVQFNVTASF